ncbi:hypothetical protein [Acinetobacter sp.]|uniref:hypothetical protein n=1 Tax=Acinetobacter sp. TaxID=472 RepID=UPI00264840BD|nr:hypothetical protein [Acinetobacter sp.]MDN5511769.1 hypothetical protein [Acinetobacter sp.]MDN5524885.1 hypothetical protein [Acinetobacter sp.]
MDIQKIGFGDFCTIEQKRYVGPNEFYGYKVVGRKKSNVWTDVPVDANNEKETLHDHLDDVVTVVCNNLDDRTVHQFRVSDLVSVRKAQAVPDLSELQEMIAGHQYFHGEHGHMIVDMDDVIKEISGFDSCKAQAVPEPVLDAPACVGAGTFQKGVKWSTVISAAQRHYKNDGHHERPAVSVADQLRIASGHSVVVPREPTELMIRAACGSDDVNEMALLEQQYKQMIEAAREQKG